MYELVNTSLPNGLIAGTHGFATVAMTKGVSDVLRGRLEALCAYAHRTSAHDATYYQQNPINWFHVVLPQGEHVVGRVAPCEFDYTGRTNRLARLRVFGATEMPVVGGAEVLLREGQWFAQPWQGEPKYLADDKATCGRLRMLNPIQASSAPSWDAVFGSKGSRYAQQVAWQVEKNLVSGGRTVYFKTSAAWDVSGEKLLGLFADVINLLPEKIRAQVTFSTYPVSLPGGTVCTLRGVYDSDKLFEASSASQAWIDCESGKVVHAELLPTSGLSTRKESRADSAVFSEGTKTTPAAMRTQGPSISASQADGGLHSGTGSYRNLLAPKKKGPDGVVVAAIVAGAAILLTACVFFVWMKQRSDQQMRESGVEAAIKELEINKDLAREEEERERLRLAEDQRRKEKQAADERERAQKEKEAQDAQDKKAKEEAKREATAVLAAAKAKLEVTHQKKQAPAFMAAELKGQGRPPKPPIGTNEVAKMRVFYYIGNTLTNEVAGFNPIKDPLTDRISEHLLYVRDPQFRVDRMEDPSATHQADSPLNAIADSPVVLWMTSKDVWFDWKHRESRRSQWFKNQDSYDLQAECFGASVEVFDVWKKSYPVEYVIIWGEKDYESCVWRDNTFNLQDAVKFVYNKILQDLEQDIDDAKQDIDKNDGKIAEVTEKVEKLRSEFSNYSSETNKLEKLKGDRENLRKELKDFQNKTKKDKKKAKKISDAEEEEIKKRQRDLNVEITKQEGAIKELRGDQIELKLKEEESKLKGLKDMIPRLCSNLERCKLEYKKGVENPNREKLVRERVFGVAVKGGVQ